MQPPPLPPEFPSYNQPIPPGAPQGYGLENRRPLMAPPRGPVVSFDSITDAWNLFAADMGVWVGASFITLTLTFITTFMMMFTLPDESNGQQFNPLFWPAFFLFCLLLTFSHGGLFRIALGQIRTGKARFSDLFNVVDVLPNLLVVTFLEGLAVLGGSCLCLIPGLLMMGLLMFAVPLVVDREKKMGAMAALSTSYNALQPQMWMALIFSLVCYLLASAGQAVCGIGMLVTLPLYYLAIAVVYRDFFLSNTPPPSQQPWQAPPPIADPKG